MNYSEEDDISDVEEANQSVDEKELMTGIAHSMPKRPSTPPTPTHTPQKRVRFGSNTEVVVPNVNNTETTDSVHVPATSTTDVSGLANTLVPTAEPTMVNTPFLRKSSRLAARRTLPYGRAPKLKGLENAMVSALSRIFRKMSSD